MAGVGRRRAVHAEDPLGPASGHHGTLPGDAVKTRVPWAQTVKICLAVARFHGTRRPRPRAVIVHHVFTHRVGALPGPTERQVAVTALCVCEQFHAPFFIAHDVH